MGFKSFTWVLQYLLFEPVDTTNELVFLFFHRRDVFLDIRRIVATRLKLFKLLVVLFEFLDEGFILETGNWIILMNDNG